MRILALETSCDETAAAIGELNTGDKKITLLSNSIASSLKLHAKTGGIIPEAAARQQSAYIIPVIEQAISTAHVTLQEIDAIAVTYGPGLIGSLLVGVETARTLAYLWEKPIIPVNHLIGHIYANFIKDSTNQKQPRLPAIALIVSGGHTDLVLIRDHGEIKWLGGTRDDAAGECFDKCARLAGYSYPGGPKIAELAKKGDPNVFQFPRPMIGSHDFEFSFSGLKTAFLNETRQRFPILRTSTEKIGWEQIVLEKHITQSQKQTLYDLCASLQQAIIDVLITKTIKAVRQYNAKSILLGGGVAANEKLREGFESTVALFAPAKSLCTDNAAMIASAALFNYNPSSWRDITVNPELYFS